MHGQQSTEESLIVDGEEGRLLEQLSVITLEAGLDVVDGLFEGLACDTGIIRMEVEVSDGLDVGLGRRTNQDSLTLPVHAIEVGDEGELFHLPHLHREMFDPAEHGHPIASELNPKPKPDWWQRRFPRVVLPDIPGPDGNRPKSGRTVPFVVAALAIVAGFAVMGSLSPAEPDAVATAESGTSTTIEPDHPVDIDFDQISPGEPFDWGGVAETDTGYAIAVTEHLGEAYFFASATPAWTDEPGGLFVWKSSDSEVWRVIGRVIDESHKVTAVISAGGRIVATGVDPDVAGFVLWESDDGVDWRRSEVAVDPGSLYVAGDEWTIPDLTVEREISSAGIP